MAARIFSFAPGGAGHRKQMIGKGEERPALWQPGQLQIDFTK
jgi:hypothetical protein